MSTIRVFSPVGRPVEHQPMGDRVAGSVNLSHRAIGILENTKPNARELMLHVADHLARRFSDVETVVERKVSAAQAAEEAIVERLRAETTLVLVGSGD